MTARKSGGLPFLKIDPNMIDHPKFEALSDRAVREWLRIASWCWKHDTDGEVTPGRWQKVPARVRNELVTVGLVESENQSTIMHDYLDWQMSSEERAKASGRMSKGGSLAMHNRWHAARNKIKEGCQYCEGKVTETLSEPYKVAYKGTNKVRITEQEKEKELTTLSGSAPVPTAHANDMHHPPRGASGPNSTAAFRLVDDTLRGQKLTSITRTALAVEVTRLWPEAEPDEIRAALLRWNSRTNIGASLLPGLLDDLRKESRGATSRAAHTAPALAPSDAFVANFLSTPAQPELRALPGGA